MLFVICCLFFEAATASLAQQITDNK